MTSAKYAEDIRQLIDDMHTFDVPYYDARYDLSRDHGTSHASIYGADGSSVAITSTINT